MNFFISPSKINNDGFTLIEVLISVAIFSILAIAVFGGFSQLMRGISILEIKNGAANLATERIEVVRSLNYEDVGLVNGSPVGVINNEEVFTSNNIDFTVRTTIRSIDDKFDGLLGGDPADDDPVDYKFVQFDIYCVDCIYPNTMSFYTNVSPQDPILGDNNNGAIFVNVLDSYGDPIQGVDIALYSDASTTTIDISDVTDVYGQLKVFDLPVGTEAYQVGVSKSGYSSDQTYETGLVDNPNPNRPHLNVIENQITSVTFTIDILSDLEVVTQNLSCAGVSGVDFNLKSSKTIGDDVYKFDQDFISSGSGFVSVNGIEWDNYSVDVFDSTYKLYGSDQFLPFKINSNTQNDLNLFVGPNDPNILLVQVKDFSTGLPVSGATVRLWGGTFDQSIETENGYVRQTDWSGGPGQENFSDDTRFFEGDSNLDYLNADIVTLDTFEGDYVSNGYLESSIIDLSTSTDFISIDWSPQDNPDNTDLKFQLATNNIVTATSTWGFVGPDGTSSTYYENSGNSINNLHDADRYLKYRSYLETSDSLSTPILSDLTISYETSCFPSGQVYFTNLDSGIYNLSVEKEGYTTHEILDFSVDQDWEMINVPFIQ
jgi:prepilin-type N-terminal cleavage/methylation domain-containing protein